MWEKHGIMRGGEDNRELKLGFREEPDRWAQCELATVEGALKQQMGAGATRAHFLQSNLVQIRS